jgi:hypothetical protein
VTANVHNPGVTMPDTVICLYCVVVEQFDVLVSTFATADTPNAVDSNNLQRNLRGSFGALNLGLAEAALQRDSQ